MISHPSTMFKSFFVIGLFILLNINLHAQSVSGNVKDERNLPLPGTTVFLIGTKIITVCDAVGHFVLSNVPPGNYDIAIKIVGYQPFIKSILVTDEPIQLKIKLKPNDNQLNEVTISADKNRPKYLAIFKREFLGLSRNAQACEIVNPEVLYFQFDKKQQLLKASADEFMIVKNNALGYLLKFLLSDFSYDEEANIVSFQGYPYFEEIKGTPTQEIAWANSRKKAYLGSITHFMRALYAHQTSMEGFSLYKVHNRPRHGSQESFKQAPYIEKTEVSPVKLVARAGAHTSSLNFDDCLYVVYKNEMEPDDYASKGYHIEAPGYNLPEGQASYLYLLTKDVIIDSNGSFNPSNGIFFEGYLGWEKVGDMLPIEY